MNKNISITILTKNSSGTICATLESTKKFHEVLVLDTGSTDNTVAMCQNFSNVKVAHAPFTGFGPTHNTASLMACNDWILSLDSDEVLSEQLQTEILNLPLREDTVYAIRRHNYFNGKRITTCSGWDPDWVVRLYNKTKCGFSLDQVHEKILYNDLQKQPLQHPMIHTPYREIADFLHKMQAYSGLFAIQNADRKGASVLTAIFHGWMAFIKSYFFKKGVMQGAEGFIISTYNAHTTFYKYLKLVDIQK
ncbi:MAG: glycosyltransferase family 2 protein [Chlamydiae bacterium]|jgi:glycosyltransferase involved in cell wall biosynthesis|nr:glycosyltransferase family 2 protein [Chlamydiota bacterium]